MRCCCQISITENYIVFDAKLTQLNQMKNMVTVYFHAFSSKANFESPLKTYLKFLVIDNVEDIHYVSTCLSGKFKKKLMKMYVK